MTILWNSSKICHKLISTRKLHLHLISKLYVNRRKENGMVRQAQCTPSEACKIGPGDKLSTQLLNVTYSGGDAGWVGFTSNLRVVFGNYSSGMLEFDLFEMYIIEKYVYVRLVCVYVDVANFVMVCSACYSSVSQSLIMKNVYLLWMHVCSLFEQHLNLIPKMWISAVIESCASRKE